ncbi:Protein shisa-9 [Tupaia chinensis]|uniref:Protein shisa-9 n=1 Tax=Tupaia chinensis TaxID=246437 RepID=L9KYU6_TUPCH|nr:Protein shisa-9 [Tupaia chinensis]
MASKFLAFPEHTEREKAPQIYTAQPPGLPGSDGALCSEQDSASRRAASAAWTGRRSERPLCDLPGRLDDPLHDPTKDKTNLIVYIICGVVAVMVLVGIFTKLGLEKAHRPQREHMSSFEVSGIGTLAVPTPYLAPLPAFAGFATLSPCCGQRPSLRRAPLALACVDSRDRAPSARLHPLSTLIRQLSRLPYSLCKSLYRQVAADGRQHLGINGAILRPSLPPQFKVSKLIRTTQ